MLRSLVVSLLLAIVSTTCLAQDSKPQAYALTRPPLAVYDALPNLMLGEVPPLPQGERELLERVWKWRTENKGAADSRPDPSAVLDAMLWASGVEDAAAREKYREQFEKVVAASEAAVKDAKDLRDRGELLMKSLHAGVMHKGYSLDQTLFSQVFDQGDFNCVSSTAMYLLVGERLGMTLVPISIPGKTNLPGHASLDLVEGKARIQIEPTNPDGFDWGTKSKRPGVIVLGYVPDRKDGHETDALGIAASIYTNRGVALAKGDQPQRLAAIRANLSALALDPTDPTAANNLLSDFINWGPALSKEGRHADAIRALTFGRTLAPKSRELAGNLVNAYIRQIEALLEGDKDADAVGVVREAAKTFPDDYRFKSAASWFASFASDRRKEDGWEAGLTALDRGTRLLAAAELEQLGKARTSLYRQWSQELLDKKDLDGSVKVLARAYAINTKDRDVHSGITYHAVQSLQLLGDDEACVAEHLRLLYKKFPEAKDLGRVGASYAGKRVTELAAAGKFEEAIAAGQRLGPIVLDEAKRAEIGALGYDLWAKDLAAKKEWRTACDKYAAGLKVFPKQPLLTDNLAVTIDDWAEPEIQAKRWDKALEIYDLGLAEYLPLHSRLKQNRAFCEAQSKAGM